MSATITTDIFCDGEYCVGNWVLGITGSKVAIRAARREAQVAGWKYAYSKEHGKLIDLCPTCQKAYDERKRSTT